jgi:hypothetical protein
MLHVHRRHLDPRTPCRFQAGNQLSLHWLHRPEQIKQITIEPFQPRESSEPNELTANQQEDGNTGQRRIHKRRVWKSTLCRDG